MHLQNATVPYNLRMSLPTTWPKPNPRKPQTLQSRISEQQKQDLYDRKITTRALAKDLGVHEKYLSHRFRGKAEVYDKKPLIEVRKAYKLEVATEVLQGKYSIQQAADVAFVSYNTMQRFVQRAKLVRPDLVAPYNAILLAQKQTTIKKARDVRKPSTTSQVSSPAQPSTNKPDATRPGPWG